MKTIHKIAVVVEEVKYLRATSITRERGFTLIEVTVVLFLVTLIIGLSSVFLASRMPAAGLDAAAREVSATIRQARALAMISSEEQRVKVDFDSKYYGMDGRGFKKIPADIGIMMLDPVYGEVREGKYEMCFTANGRSQGGDFVLWNSKKTITVRLDPVVGSVKIRN